jgi:NhaA family Na+:H+ antiporter
LVCVLKSGVHATLAGVVVALAIPSRRDSREAQFPLKVLEVNLHPWIVYGVLPLFAFANAGVSLHGLSLWKMLDPIPLGIVFGLLVGKPVGIFGAAWLAIVIGLAVRPEGVTWRQGPACWAV